MTLLKRTCKEVAAILVAREDRHLGLADRLALRLHMAMCEACPRFERQILTMRNSMRQWRNYADSDDSAAGGAPQK
ncbi:MAG: zf-HC2 domain-containing protein [Rhodoferax sp.]